MKKLRFYSLGFFSAIVLLSSCSVKYGCPYSLGFNDTNQSIRMEARSEMRDLNPTNDDYGDAHLNTVVTE